MPALFKNGFGFPALSIRQLLAVLLASISVTVAAESTHTAMAQEIQFDSKHRLGLQQTLEYVRANDLTLTQLEYEANAYHSEAEGAKAFPDPVLFAGLQNLPSDTFDLDQEPMTQFRFGIRQMFPKGDSLDIQQRMSTINEGMQSIKQQWRLRSLRKAVEQAWLEAWYWQKNLMLIQEDRVFLMQVLDFVQSLYEVGTKSQSDLLGAQLELIKLDESRIAAEQQYQLFRSELNTLANTRLPGERLSDELVLLDERKALTIETKSLLDRLMMHPEMAILGDQVALSDQSVMMAEQSFEPSWGLELAYGLRGEDMSGAERADFLSAGISVDLPLFSKSKQNASLSAAKSRRASFESRRQETMLQRRFQFESLRQQFKITRQQRELYERDILPKLVEQKESAMRSYETDSGDFRIVSELFRKEQSAKTKLQRLRVNEQKLLSAMNYWIADEGEYLL